MSYANIPMELRFRAQWIVSGPDKVPLNPRTGEPASVVDASTWGTFEQACAAGYKNIGFVFSAGDDYCGVDLDNPKILKVNGHTVPNENVEEVRQIEERHKKACQLLNSYTERSISGHGLHIICRGKVPSGVRRDKMEIYSDSRYFVFTGDVVNNAPITDCQETLTQLWQEMQNGSSPVATLEETPATLSDEAIMQMAWNAENRDKFQHLWQGNLNGYPSQSEGDFALMAMLAFYTPSNEQARRIFRKSVLGQREKTNKNDYHLNLMLAKIRGRQQAETLPPVDISELLAKYAPVLPPAPLLPADYVPTPPSCPMFPPGLIGEIADYVFASAMRPVPEIGLAAAIAFGAGFLGRQFQISSTGLNQYIILLAGTGTGKEYCSGGIESLVSEVRQQIPQVDDFMGPSTFASGQALTRCIDKSNCFVSILGEFGLTLQQMCDKNASAHQVQLRKVLLDLYLKSSSGSHLRPSAYSDADKNTGLIKSPALTILGESTPGRFYDVLDSAHVAEGLVPRFLVIEYTGKRPAPNPNAFCPIPQSLKDNLIFAFQTIIAMKYGDQYCNVPLDADAKILMDDYNLWCDEKVNTADDEITKQLWTRAHLKALKLAGLVGAGCAVQRPKVTKEVAQWALDLVTKDVDNMTQKFATGDIGHGDHKCEADVMKAINKYAELTPKQRAAYNVPEILRDKAMAVPFVYLKKYCSMRSSFRNDRRGAVVTLDVTLKDLLKAGIVQQIPAPVVKGQWNIDSPIYYRGESWN